MQHEGIIIGSQRLPMRHVGRRSESRTLSRPNIYVMYLRRTLEVGTNHRITAPIPTLCCDVRSPHASIGLVVFVGDDCVF